MVISIPNVIKKDHRFKTTNIVKDISLLEPVFRKKVMDFLADAKKEGHDLRIAETFRSQARQAHLYEQGYTQLRHVGVHNYGLACDFNLFINRTYQDHGGNTLSARI